MDWVAVMLFIKAFKPGFFYLWIFNHQNYCVRAETQKELNKRALEFMLDTMTYHVMDYPITVKIEDGRGERHDIAFK